MISHQKKANSSKAAREKRVRLKIKEQTSRPRLVVFKSTLHIYAQIIDDLKQKTVVSSSTLLKDYKSLGQKMKGIDAAKWVGQNIAQKALEAGIKQVVFDRGSFLYHGRVKALAEAARSAGLEF